MRPQSSSSDARGNGVQVHSAGLSQNRTLSTKELSSRRFLDIGARRCCASLSEQRTNMRLPSGWPACRVSADYRLLP